MSENLPQVFVGPDEWRIAEETITALAANADNLFQRGGSLVRIVRDAKPKSETEPEDKPMIAVASGTPTIAVAPEANIRETVTRYVSLCKRTEDGPKRVNPPAWLAKALYARGQWDGIKPLVSIAEAPFLRSDGSVVQENGYDARTGAFCSFNAQFSPIVPDPPQEAVQDAVRSLMEAVSNFPFEKECHKSVWVAALLSVVCRQSFEGNVPFFTLSANIRGTGKTMLVHLISIIAFGRECAPSGFTPEDEESRKQITTALLTGAPMFLLDDVATAFGGVHYNRLSTSSHWQDRAMGGNKTVILPTLPVWFITGNNLVYKGDIVRRYIPLKLESREEHPENRRDFEHANLLEWAKRERVNLHNAALTIMAGFFAAGKPSMSLDPFGSYEAWSSTVRAAVVWAGMADPCESRTDVSTTDDVDRNFAGSMIEMLRLIDTGAKGLSAGQIIFEAEKGFEERKYGRTDVRIDLLDLLAPIAPRGAKLPDARMLGTKLGGIRGRVVNDLMIVSRVRRGTTVWKVATKEGAVVQELPFGEEEAL